MLIQKQYIVDSMTMTTTATPVVVVETAMRLESKRMSLVQTEIESIQHEHGVIQPVQTQQPPSMLRRRSPR